MDQTTQLDKSLLSRFPRHWHSLGQVQMVLGLSPADTKDFLDKAVTARKVEHLASPTVAWRLRK